MSIYFYELNTGNGNTITINIDKVTYYTLNNRKLTIMFENGRNFTIEYKSKEAALQVRDHLNSFIANI